MRTDIIFLESGTGKCAIKINGRQVTQLKREMRIFESKREANDYIRKMKILLKVNEVVGFASLGGLIACIIMGAIGMNLTIPLAVFVTIVAVCVRIEDRYVW